MDWDAITPIPDSAKAGAEALVRSGSQQYRYQIDGGWVVYVDSQHTEGAPQSILADARTQVTVDALGAGTETRYARRMATGPWVSNTFAPRGLGDAYLCRLNCTIASQAPGSGHYVDFELAIGSGYSTIVTRQRESLVKAQGVSDLITVVFPFYCLETFGATGGRFYITPSHDITLWGKSLFIQRTFAP